jgi:hypothetical protein
MDDEVSRVATILTLLLGMVYIDIVFGYTKGNEFLAYMIGYLGFLSGFARNVEQFKEVVEGLRIQ